MNDTPSPQHVSIGFGFSAVRTTFAPNHRLDDHEHRRATLSIPFSGSYLEVFGRHEHRMDPGRILYRRPGLGHENIIGSKGFDGVLVEVEPARHDWIADALGLRQDCHGVDAAQARPLIREFRRAWESEDPAQPLRLESALLQLLATLTKKRVSPSRPHWIGRVVDALREAYPRRPTLGELAEVAGVHPMHLAQSFRRHMGRSVGEFVDEERVAAIRRGLAESQSPLASLALDNGFADQSHMTRVFRRMVGTTPARYRKQNQSQ